MTLTPPPDAGFFQREFDLFCLACFGDITAQQYLDMRRTFFGGATALLGAAMRALSPGGDVTEADLAMVRTLRDEIIEFNAAVKRGEK
jgi:hypothetical protein